jgi:hypothetical protein
MSSPSTPTNNQNMNIEEKDYPFHKLTWMISSTGINVPVVEPMMSLPFFSGRLIVNVKRAMNLYNASRMGRMDPFCEVKIGGEKRKTTIHKKGDVHPIWDEALEFHLRGTEQTFRLRVFNKTLISSTLLGTARVRLDNMLMLHGIRPANAMSPACINQDSHTAWFDIGRDSRQSAPAGSVLISLSFQFDDPNALSLMTPLQKLARSDMIDSINTPTNNIIGVPQSGNGGRSQSVIQVTSFDANNGITSPAASAARTRKAESVIEVSTNRNSANNMGAAPLSNVNSTASSRAPSPLHSRSGSLAYPDDSPHKSKLFGGSLHYGVHRSKDCVPVVVYVCIQYLLYHGLNSVGLFRVSGSSELKEQIKDAFETSDYVSIADPNVTADVLKTYFRQLAEPLIPSASFDLFASITDTRNREISIVKLREAVMGLPKDNYIVLSYLLHFLNRVADNAEVNKMTRRNLALVFGPNLMRKTGQATYAGSDAGILANEMRQAEECILLMLEGYSTLFPVSRNYVHLLAFHMH